MNYKMISNILGWLLIFESMFLAVPMLTAVVYWESTFWAFLGTAAFCLAAGVLITRKKPKNTTLYSREGFIIVALSWIILSLFGALPFTNLKNISNVFSYKHLFQKFQQLFLLVNID